MSGMLEKLAVSPGSSLHVQVFEAIERAILGGEFKGGESLTELRLSGELGVSRTPVREALRQLELEGLVKTVPNKGAVVVGVTEKDIEDIYVIRIRIEDLAVRWAAESLTGEALAELKELAALQEFYANRGDLEKLCALDGTFHEAIYRASRSRPLEHMLTGFHHYIRHARSVSFKRSGRALKAVAEHREIVEALERRDAEQAATLMVAHITKARDNLLATLRQNQEAQQ